MSKVSMMLLAGVGEAAHTPKTVTIAPGVEMPLVNFGICDHKQALQNGVRGFDTAFSYGDDDQADVGKTVLESGMNRSDLFVLTKIPCCKASEFWGIGVDGCNQGGRNPDDDLQHDMDKIGLDYVDLMLMHWGCDNMDDTVNVYKAMEKFKQAGKARAIGVSNFNADMLDELVSKTTIVPAVNQVGFSVGNHAKDIQNLPSRQHWGCDDATLAKAKELGTTTMAFSPLGGHGFYDVMHDATVEAVAAAKNRSTAQVGLRWLAQQGVAFVTSSNTPAHITADFEIFDFELSDDEMTRLSSVNRPDLKPPVPVAGCKVATTAQNGAQPAMSGYGGGDYTKAWDGDTGTFYDYSQAYGGWTQASLPSPAPVSGIRWYPRANFQSRHVGGRFVGVSASNQEVTLGTISQVADGWNVLNTTTDGSKFSSVKYYSPDGGYGNIAEIEVYSPCASAAIVV